MTEKQNKTLLYAGFTEAQIAALAAVFPVLPPPERRAEIDGFVKRTVEKMKRIDEAVEGEWKPRLDQLKNDMENLIDRLNENAPPEDGQ